MSTLCITEFGHQRILGILNTIISVIESLIPPWHLSSAHMFFRDRSCGGGLSQNIIPTASNPDSVRRSKRQSRKAMKIWNTAILYLIDGPMWGIHPKIINFLRMHLMLASRWFAPSHSLRDHVLMRTYMNGDSS